MPVPLTCLATARYNPTARRLALLGTSVLRRDAMLGAGNPDANQCRTDSTPRAKPTPARLNGLPGNFAHSYRTLWPRFMRPLCRRAHTPRPNNGQRGAGPEDCAARTNRGDN